MTLPDLIAARAAIREAIAILDTDRPDLADIIDPIRLELTAAIDAVHAAEAE